MTYPLAQMTALVLFLYSVVKLSNKYKFKNLVMGDSLVKSIVHVIMRHEK